MFSVVKGFEKVASLHQCSELCQKTVSFFSQDDCELREVQKVFTVLMASR